MDSSKMDSASHDAYKLSFPSAKQFRETCLPQEFPFPMTIMKYIWENPVSPKAYQKLIQCCKFFYIKNPILIIDILSHSRIGWAYCDNDECESHYNCLHVQKEIDIDNFVGKLWLTKKFSVRGFSERSIIASNLIPKIYKCQVKRIVFSNQHLSYNQLKWFSTGVESCKLDSCVVKYDNGEQVLLENLIKLFPEGVKLFLNFSKNPYNATVNSYADLVDACKDVKLWFIPDTFNIPEFYRQLKNSKSRALIAIHAPNQYRNPAVNDIIKEILQTETFDFIPPAINVRSTAEVQLREAAKYR